MIPLLPSVRTSLGNSLRHEVWPGYRKSPKSPPGRRTGLGHARRFPSMSLGCKSRQLGADHLSGGRFVQGYSVSLDRSRLTGLLCREELSSFPAQLFDWGFGVGIDTLQSGVKPADRGVACRSVRNRADVGQLDQERLSRPPIGADASPGKSVADYADVPSAYQPWQSDG